MKKTILIPLLVSAIVLAGCQWNAPATNTPATGSQNTGTQSTENTQEPDNQVSYHFNLNGTEPFWGANISGGKATNSMPDDNAENNIFTTTIGVSAMGDDDTIVFTNINEQTVITLLQELCSDGM